MALSLSGELSHYQETINLMTKLGQFFRSRLTPALTAVSA